ncbi:sensor histidine kinase [Kitasatospora sp. NPDC054939]
MISVTWVGSGPRLRWQPASAQARLTLAGACAVLCLAAAGLWAGYLLIHHGEPGAGVSADQLVVLGYALAAAAGGVLLHAHRPGNQLGWVLLACALGVIVPRAAAAPLWVEVSDPAAVAVVVVLQSAGFLVFGTLFVTLPLWLPEGRLPHRAWWLVIGALALWRLPLDCYLFSRPTVFGRANPFHGTWLADAVGDFIERWRDAQLATSYALVALAVVVLLVRTRRAEPGRRRTVLLLLGSYLLWAGAQTALAQAYPSPTAARWLFVAASALWSAVLVLLVIRDGSWRLDRAARRVLVGLLVAAGLTVAFVLLAAVLSGLLFPWRGLQALLLLAGLLALSAVLPRATRWAVGLVDRLYYGNRAHPYRVLRTLAVRVGQVVDPQDVPTTLCTTVAEELRLPGVRLTVRTRAGERTLAAVGAPADGQGFPLVHRGEEIGRLTVGLRTGQSELDQRDTDVLGSLADQAAPTVASLHLLEDLRASRGQIVAAREEERRQLRRDIHDGLGPLLAGLRLRVENAAAMPVREETVSATLATLSDQLDLAVKEVRQITGRLGPAALGQHGLSGALRNLGETFSSRRLAVTVRLTPEALPALPAAIEVAVYRIAAEALNNVVRHAHAGHARVAVAAQDGRLVLTVDDDGLGFAGPPEHPGVGLRSMSERAAEIGGSCTVGALDPGTRVYAVLPWTPGEQG